MRNSRQILVNGRKFKANYDHIDLLIYIYERNKLYLNVYFEDILFLGEKFATLFVKFLSTILPEQKIIAEVQRFMRYILKSTLISSLYIILSDLFTYGSQVSYKY